jgi:hypothetical protein
MPTAQRNVATPGQRRGWSQLRGWNCDFLFKPWPCERHAVRECLWRVPCAVGCLGLSWAVLGCLGLSHERVGGNAGVTPAARYACLAVRLSRGTRVSAVRRVRSSQWQPLERCGMRRIRRLPTRPGRRSLVHLTAATTTAPAITGRRQPARGTRPNNRFLVAKPG